MGNWPWQQLLFKIRPLMGTAEKRKEMDELVAEYDEMKKELDVIQKERKRLEAEHTKIIQMKNNLMNQFAGENDAVQDAEDRYESLLKTKSELDGKVKEFTERLEDEEEINADLT